MSEPTKEDRGTAARLSPCYTSWCGTFGADDGDGLPRLRRCSQCARADAIAVALATVRAEERDMPGEIYSCPWCGLLLSPEPARTQTRHLIACGDQRIANVRAEAARQLTEELRAYDEKWMLAVKDAVAEAEQAQRERDALIAQSIPGAASLICPYGNDKPGDATWTHTEQDICPVCKKNAHESAGYCTAFVGYRIAEAIRRGEGGSGNG